MAEAFVKVEHDTANARARAKAARAHIAEQYSLDAMLSHHENVYDQLMG